ncbi:hypothetical protein CTA1_646 [Colletotrichum tanaceti]|uniref:Uncharacterized protein n=1 Tax=Colletotrichum tanaceti TaxID=1306861 RepID=A0A4U6XSQ9_9PEZI|nr:hypothetical protein CTA1_646 [Colletotrichum tanaceti]
MPSGSKLTGFCSSGVDGSGGGSGGGEEPTVPTSRWALGIRGTLPKTFMIGAAALELPGRGHVEHVRDDGEGEGPPAAR